MPPPVITVGNVKGGAGKTTTAVQLALHAGRDRRVLLVDADPGRSAMSWATQAPDWDHDQVPVVAYREADLPRRLPGLAAGFGLVVVDTPHDPSDETTVGPMLAAAIAAADLLVVPSPPSFADLDRLGDMRSVIEREQNRRDLAWCLALVRADLRRRASVLETRDALRGRGLPVLGTLVPERAAVEDAFGTADRCMEYGPLADEVLALLDLEAGDDAAS